MTHDPFGPVDANGVDMNGYASGEVLCLLDRDVTELFADVDAILCAALQPRRRPPAPPATGCALDGPRSAGRSLDGSARARREWTRRHAGPVRATQRGPPEPRWSN